MKLGMPEKAVRILLLVVMALVFLANAGYFLIFFIPISAWFIWRAHDKTVELEKRLAALEKPKEKNPDGT